MKQFDPKNGWLFQLVGGPEDGQYHRIDHSTRPDPSDPPHMETLEFRSRPDGQYIRTQVGLIAKYGKREFDVWQYVWTPIESAAAA